MSEFDKPTELYDPNRREGFMPGVGRPQMTEVLEPKGPRLIAMLVGLEGAPGIAGHVFRLSTVAATTLGRDYECDIVIDEPAVSRQHAKVKLDEVEKGRLQFFIQDLATENGTVVNGQKVIKHYLNENDRITLGRATLIFKIIDPSAGV
ncbi:MAG: FHA domain-containing protein [Anaerolineales bacterium]|uniref:FHA domain-containing protein n=1 Tax=Promineifilum sp. TaxID=2664178 RepID=UPI001D4A15BC|nr:FHA domain-containing protein [Anaerolineales bacterium]MCO5181867.1 FHA domain-containing protein [Promineifilum sp.]